MPRFTFGPVPSRRFGMSLGIDLTPETKQCNFDCLYCELKSARPQIRMEHPPSAELILQEVAESVQGLSLDVLTITANGEPTLHPELGAVVDGVNRLKGQAQSLILSNGTTIVDSHIRMTLGRLDMVKLSLDCVTPKCFKKLDRPARGISIEPIIAAMIDFRQEYRGVFILETLFVKGVNDLDTEIEALHEAYGRICPDRVDIGTIDRPPAYAVQPLSAEELYRIADRMQDVPISVASRQPLEEQISLSDEAIAETLKRRPLCDQDVMHLWDMETRERLKCLVEQGHVRVSEVGKLRFYIWRERSETEDMMV